MRTKINFVTFVWPVAIALLVSFGGWAGAEVTTSAVTKKNLGLFTSYSLPTVAYVTEPDGTVQTVYGTTSILDLASVPDVLVHIAVPWVVAATAAHPITSVAATGALYSIVPTLKASLSRMSTDFLPDGKPFPLSLWSSDDQFDRTLKQFLRARHIRLRDDEQTSAIPRGLHLWMERNSDEQGVVTGSIAEITTLPSDPEVPMEVRHVPLDDLFIPTAPNCWQAMRTLGARWIR